MSNRVFRAVGSVSGLALMVGLPHAALAQQSNEPTAVGEIVVTAQKREQALNDVGLTIAAIGAQSLDDRGVRSVEDLTKVVPGFTAATTPIGPPVYSLRGIGFYDSSLAASPAVTVYVDETPLPYPSMTLGAGLDLSRVEVLKGPQGTLFGQNSTGGAINYIAAKPTDDLTAGIEASYGSFNTVDLRGHVSGALSDSLSARIAASYLTADPWQRSHTRDDKLGAKDLLIGRLLLDFHPNERFNALLSISGWRDGSDSMGAQFAAFRPQSPAGVLPALANYPLSPKDNRSADWGPGRDYARDNSFTQISLRMDLNLTDDIVLTSLTSQSNYQRDEFVDSDGIALRIADRKADGEIKAFNQELRLANNPASQFRWVAGVNYSTDESSDLVYNEYPDNSAAYATGRHNSSITFFSDQDFESVGIFGNIEYDLSEVLTLKLGARYTETSRDFRGCSRDSGDGDTAAAFTGLWSALNRSPITPIGLGECITLLRPYVPGEVVLELNEDNVSWRAGIDWHINDDALFYANVSQGYKAGAFPTASATSAAQYVPVPQESVLAYEAGIKTSLLDKRANLTAAAFYYDYSDKQLRGRIADPVFRSLEALVSVPEASVFGQEVSFQYRPVDGLTLDLSATHLDATIDKYSGFNDFGVATNFDDTPMPFTPEWQVTAAIDYEWQLSDGLRASVGGNLLSRSGTYSTPGTDKVFHLDGYQTVDLRVAIRPTSGNWRMSVWGRNVTDETYTTNIQRSVDTIARYLGMPATYGVTLSWAY